MHVQPRCFCRKLGKLYPYVTLNVGDEPIDRNAHRCQLERADEYVADTPAREMYTMAGSTRRLEEQTHRGPGLPILAAFGVPDQVGKRCCVTEKIFPVINNESLVLRYSIGLK